MRTPTVTPFQPLADTATPAPVAVDPGAPQPPTSTFDPNAVLPADATPQSFYSPPYAPHRSRS